MDAIRKRPWAIRAAWVSLAVLLCAGAATPLRASADSIEALQNQYAQLQKQQQQLQSQISSQSSAVQTGQAQAADLNAQISVTRQQLALLQAQVDATGADIQSKEHDIAAAQAQQDYNMNLLKQRLRALYMSGQDTFLDVLLSSSSLSDFFTRAEIVRAVSEHDQQIIDDLKQTESRLEADRAALRKTQQDQLAAQGAMAAKQNTLNAQVARQNQLVAQAQAGVQAAQQQAAAVNAQASQTYAKITEAFAEQAAAARAAASAKNAGGAVGTITVGGSNLSGSVLAYQGTVTQVAAQFGMSSYVKLILAVMEQESDGQGGDVMQAEFGNACTPAQSIADGIQELQQDLQMAGCTGPGDITDIQLALQGYNFGWTFIPWAKGKGGYSLANALAFSAMEAKAHGWSSYGDPYYVPHVLRYYTVG